MNSKLACVKIADVFGYRPYYSFHHAFSPLFDFLADVLFIMMYALAAITYVVSVLVSAVRLLRGVFVWIPAATGRIYRRLRGIGRRREDLWLPGSAR